MADASADMAGSSAPSTAALRRLACGAGWRVSDIVCTAGPTHRSIEERHDFVSIAVVAAGSFTYRSTHGAVALAPGALLLGNLGHDFACGHEHAAGDRCVAFNYTKEMFAEIAAATPGVTRDTFAIHRIPAIAATAGIVAAATAAIAPQAASGTAFLDWEELAAGAAGRALTLLAGQPPVCRRAMSARDEKRVADAVRLIDARHAEPLSLAALAASCCMSRYHFLRVFRDVVGVTPHQYLLRTRLRHAAVRLRVTNEAITVLAFDVGFGDLSTFNAAFRCSYGISPSGYRARSLHRGG